MDEAPVWVVLARSIAHVVDESAFVAMVLDQGTGLVSALSIDTSQGSALRAAMAKALTEPAADLPPAPPALVLCCGLEPARVRQQLTRLLPKTDLPPIHQEGIDEAEDIFDSLVGRMSGRDQPQELPTPDAWRALMAATAEYARAQPWVRWPDDELAEVGITVDGGSDRYLASVIGASGVQRGLNLFPGGRLPNFGQLHGSTMPAGTLIVWLDEHGDGDEVAPEFVGKAQRYGWPDDLPLLPTYLSFGRTGPADLSNVDVRRLTVGIGAVVQQSRRPTAPPVGRARRGTVPVDADAVGSYTLRLVR